MRKVYLDNVVASALHGRPLANSEEQAALERLRSLESEGRLEFRISAEVLRETERTQNTVLKARLMAGVRALVRVEHDHLVIGFQSQDLGYRGCIVSPLVTDVIDEPQFSALTQVGLKRRDAMHLMYANRNRCDVFLTTDPDFINRRLQLEAICPDIKVMTPIELLAELGQADNTTAPC